MPKNKTEIRIQKSRDKSYFQFVLIFWDANGIRHKRYFSTGYWILVNFVQGTSGSNWIMAEEMFAKDTKAYEEFIEKRKEFKFDTKKL